MNITDMEVLSKTKIAIVGLGGVGAYYGGLLSRFAEKENSLEVSFLVRGENLKKIGEDGLKVVVGKKEFVTRPALATDQASAIGPVDYVIMATKSYDLDAILQQIEPLLKKDTVILPLLNGIDITTRIRKTFPEQEVWYGCVYIVSRLTEPGVVESMGNVHFFHFGSDKTDNPERLQRFEQVLKSAGIEATLKEDAVKAVWRKYFYISPTASLTTFLNVDFPGLVHDKERKMMYVGMMEELLSISKAEGVDLHEGIIDDMLRYGGSLPAGTTASMNSDYLAGRPIELDTLTGIVVKLGRKHGIDTPLYEMIYKHLKA